MTLRPSVALLTSLGLLAHAAVAQSPTHPDSLVGASQAKVFHTATARKAVQRGKVSWYGRAFAGRKTASGERFDPSALTMAHRTLPLGAIVEVTNDANGKRV